MISVFQKINSPLIRIFNRSFCSEVKNKKASIYDDANPKEISEMINLDIINYADDRVFFHSYSAYGFTFTNNLKVYGAVTTLPQHLLFWNVRSFDQINENSLQLISVIEPKLDIAIIGKGPRSFKPDMKRLHILSKKMKTNFEILPSEEAMSLFNFLNNEDRNVGAFILPVRDFAYDPEDQAEIMKRRRKNFTMLLDSESVTSNNLNLTDAWNDNTHHTMLEAKLKSLEDESDKLAIERAAKKETQRKLRFSDPPLIDDKTNKNNDNDK